MEERNTRSLFAPPYLTGIFGYNIKYSLSPLLHSFMNKIVNANLCYGRFDVSPENFADAFNGFKALGMKGANITKPYKTEVLKYIDFLSPESNIVGAVNTVNLEEEGYYRGYNTDIDGFIKAVNYEFKENLNGKNVILIGAGGASRAVLYALIKEDVKNIIIVNRSEENAVKLKKEADLWKIPLNSYADIIYSDFNHSVLLKKLLSKKWDIIVNTITPSDESEKLINSLFGGMETLNGKLFFFDISYSTSYNPLTSPDFLKIYNEKSFKYTNGLSMLLFQAIESFYIWTGKRVDFNVAKEVLTKNQI